MDLRYIMYANTDKDYYYPPNTQTKKSAYKIPKQTEGWQTEIDEHNHWRYMMYEKNNLPEQGWKIHISAPIYAAQKILDLCAPILMEKNVDFKYVDSEWELFLKNSKYGDRGGAGKFITIYPNDVKQFEDLIFSLAEVLKGTPNGPYILSDKCWKDSNVFFRYGGIRPMYADIGGSRVLAIKNINGEFMEDTRGPSYSLPDFVEEPDFIKRAEEEMAQLPEQPSKLDEYEIIKALHFSNAGGVYVAKRKDTGQEVILKEGRPESGIDGDFRDAHFRIYHEAQVLDRLNDVPQVINYYGIFKEWKHIFLEEEYHTGTSLNSWVTLRYPFVKGIEHKLEKDYSANAAIILRNLVEALKAMHNKNIGMGDLQPMNLMIDEDSFAVRIIDLEAADALQSNNLPALVTPGFTTSRAKNRLQGDWFAMSRIARDTFLPIGPVQDLDEGILIKHDIWIEKNFGSGAMDIIREIEMECEKHLKPEEKQSDGYHKFWTLADIKTVKNKIRNGIESDLKVSEILIGGDIRQFEETGGKLNVKTGGFGVLLALHRTGTLPEKAKKWLYRYSKEKYVKSLDSGLYSGKSGIACVLYECGFKERAKEILLSINIPKDTQDVSIAKGLSGMGIAFLSLMKCERIPEIEIKLDEVTEKLIELVKTDLKLTIDDPDGIPVGLFHGWTGVSLFFLMRYIWQNDKEWLDFSLQALQKDIDCCIFDDNGIFYVDDDKRFFPYLDGGSLGIGMVLLELKKYMPKEFMQKELEGLDKQNHTRCCHNGGLFHGYAGFLAYANSAGFSGLDEMFQNMNIFLIESKENIYCPGNYAFKFSADISTGSAGILLTLQDIVNKQNFSWLPIVNVHEWL